MAEDTKRIKRTESYAEAVRRLFARTVADILALGHADPGVATGVMYSFDGDTRKRREAVERLIRQLHAAAATSIRQGISQEWEQADKATDALFKDKLGKEALATAAAKGGMQRNAEAMRRFISRSDAGMNLSDRVWQSARQLRDEMEIAITAAIGSGEDAGNLSRAVRRYLDDPDLMFRRFRYKDENGEWRKKWKKRVRDETTGRVRFIDYDRDAYRTGPGVYKSAAKNAMRLARTETNMAYRAADCDRWQRSDFVLGIHIETSDHTAKGTNRERDICDLLEGDYPKDFVFEGWHPQCFCIATPILMKPDELMATDEGKEPTSKPVNTYPAGFRQWCSDNADKIKAAQQAGKEPYFVKHNRTAVDKALKRAKQDKQIIDKAHKAATPQTDGTAFVSFEPFSPVIISKIKEITDRRQRATLFSEILNDNRAELLNADIKTGAKTTCFPANNGRKTSSWEATQTMAADLNRYGRSVCFLPEYKETTSADAIIQFQKQWRIADFKHSTTDNHNTIATDLAKGFTQAQCVVLKMEHGNLNTFKEIIRQLKRSDVHIGDFVVITKYGDVVEIAQKDIRTGRFLKLLKGRMK